MVSNVSTIASRIDLSRIKRRPGSVMTGRGAWYPAVAALGFLVATADSRAAQVPSGSPPVDAILELVPSDAALILTVEGLRDQLHALTASRLFSDLKQLPAVKSWLESDNARQLRHSRNQIETVLGISVNDVCDDLIGDALVLALRLSPEAPASGSHARGLLLFQRETPRCSNA